MVPSRSWSSTPTARWSWPAPTRINGKAINPSWQHSGTVDWEGNVYIIERDAHRIVKLSPKMDRFLLQIGTTMEKGNGRTISTCPRASPC